MPTRWGGEREKVLWGKALFRTGVMLCIDHTVTTQRVKPLTLTIMNCVHQSVLAQTQIHIHKHTHAHMYAAHARTHSHIHMHAHTQAHTNTCITPRGTVT